MRACARSPSCAMPTHLKPLSGGMRQVTVSNDATWETGVIYPMIASSLKTGALVGVVAGATLAADTAMQVNETTNISLSVAASVAVTVFMCGMWISRKLTRIEDRLDESDRSGKESMRHLSERIDQLPCNKWPIRKCDCDKTE